MITKSIDLFNPERINIHRGNELLGYCIGEVYSSPTAQQQAEFDNSAAGIKYLIAMYEEQQKPKKTAEVITNQLNLF